MRRKSQSRTMILLRFHAGVERWIAACKNALASGGSRTDPHGPLSLSGIRKSDIQIQARQ